MKYLIEKVTLIRESDGKRRNFSFDTSDVTDNEETGGDRDQVHEELKAKFLPWENVRGMYGKVTRPVSTTTLDTVQFTQYLEKVQAFASAELGIILPNPEDLAFESFEEYYRERIWNVS